MPPFQCEVALMVLSVGRHAENLWLVGDTAQAVTHGVNFRFDGVSHVVPQILAPPIPRPKY